MDASVRSFENRLERLAAPQPPVRTWLGVPATQTGFILPRARGGYRHGFGGCGCGMGAVGDTGMSSTALMILLGGGLLLAYTLLK